MAECEKCQDTGWVSGRDPDGLTIAVRCGCLEQHRAEDLEVKAQIPRKYANCDLTTFDIEDGPFASELKRIHTTIMMYAREFPTRSDPHGLLLWGSNGVGKTHLAVSALRRVIKKGYDGRYVNYQSLLRTIRNSYDQAFGAARNEEYEAITDATVLLLDDLGANRVSDWVEDTITELIAQRHDREEALIITTNYSPVPVQGKEYLADRIGERATSRIREMCKLIPMPYIEDQRGKRPYQTR